MLPGNAPTNNSNASMPADQTSDLALAMRPSQTSGAMYAGEPVILCESSPPCCFLMVDNSSACPKSANLQWHPSSDKQSPKTRMFSGLTSPWTYPAWFNLRRPRRISTNMRNFKAFDTRCAFSSITRVNMFPSEASMTITAKVSCSSVPGSRRRTSGWDASILTMSPPPRVLSTMISRIAFAKPRPVCHLTDLMATGSPVSRSIAR
mmetsp:Transcript_72420/g.209667  ORF Transcript_72420/g.209667 Transcript_72420/m.209667 type:complete len:206 (+) Transcript_72420:360-977(+)